MIKDQTMHGLIIYASKYGSTAEYALLMAQKLNTQALRAPAVPSEAVSEVDFIVLGSPIYGYSVLPEMQRFLLDNKEILVEKPIAAFVVCGDTLWNPRSGEGGQKNLEKLTKHLPVKPFATVILGGRMRMEQLDNEDEPKIRAFYNRIGREALGFDRMEMGSALAFVGEIKRRLEAGGTARD
jgi:menaquinone-dependent protoporphyrinogen IX oxidase